MNEEETREILDNNENSNGVDNEIEQEKINHYEASFKQIMKENLEQELELYEEN